jgi:hypothetical protein
MFNNKTLAPLYLIAFVASLIAFVFQHKWYWLPVAAAWLLLGIYSYMKYNKGDDNDLKK